jgi:hypothetical protein
LSICNDCGMNSATPADLAITFRGLRRRLTQALGDTPPDLTAGGRARLDELVADAARLMHCPADALVVASTIEDVPANEWDDHVLEQLRTIGLHIGATLREISELSEA